MSKTKVHVNYTIDGEVELDADRFFKPKRIYVNESKGLVSVDWPDHTRTTSKCSGDDIFSLESGFRACLAKKVFGGYQSYTKYFKKAVYNKKKVTEPKEMTLEEVEKRLGFKVKIVDK